jgi:hypothetical protein
MVNTLAYFGIASAMKKKSFEILTIVDFLIKPLALSMIFLN